MKMAAMATLAMLAMLLLVATAATDDRIEDLVNRRAAAGGGAIPLDDASVRHLAASKDRPYDLLFFFDSNQLREQRQDLNLQGLRSEFELVAQAYSRSNPEGSEGNTKLFFCVVYFENAQASYQAFGITSLPNIRLVRAGSSPLSAADKVEGGPTAEELQSFLRSRVKFELGQITRPPPFSTKQIVIVMVLTLVSGPFVLRKILASNWVYSPVLWCIGALVVYFFSVSGGMFNIIRKMPFFVVTDRNTNKRMYFYQGSGNQFAVEGFTIGSLYSVFGLMLAFVTHFLPGVKSKTYQRGLMTLALIVCFWTVYEVVYLNNWKTGYSIHHYLRF